MGGEFKHAALTRDFPILIAEDDENDALIVQRALRKVGFNNPFHISRDGLDVIRYLKGEEPYHDRQKFQFPRMLFSDLKMPRMNGFELLKWLHEHPECNVIPRIVLSASNQRSDVLEAYRLGANSYIVKPSTFEQLVANLRLLLEYWQMCEKPPLPPKC